MSKAHIKTKFNSKIINKMKLYIVNNLNVIRNQITKKI